MLRCPMTSKDDFSMTFSFFNGFVLNVLAATYIDQSDHTNVKSLILPTNTRSLHTEQTKCSFCRSGLLSVHVPLACHHVAQQPS
jgi:hypothetical protein